MAEDGSIHSDNENERRINFAGNYRRKITPVEHVEFQDFDNPWNFFSLFNSSDEVVYEWLSNKGLMAASGQLHCNRENCLGQMMTKKRNKSGTFGLTLRCSLNRGHEVTIRKNSFFEKSKLDPRDIMELTRSYLNAQTLAAVARSAGVSYGHTAVDWGCFLREVFKYYYQQYIVTRKFDGVVEIDESLFGRRVKYHRGNPTKGLKVWVFGIVHRDTNSIILYPVRDRSANTLIPLIQRHVNPGATIYSDGYASYLQLNEIGYRHFTVIHKYAFKKTYTNPTTNESETVHTNRIEGAWKHAKDHFRRMSGTKALQWEGHMAEIMWRSDVKRNVFHSFFNLLKDMYPLDRPSNVVIRNPLFDSWDGFGARLENEDRIIPNVTDAESQTTDSDAMEVGEAAAPNDFVQQNPLPIPEQNISPIAGCSNINRKKNVDKRKRPVTSAVGVHIDLTIETDSNSDMEVTVVGNACSTPVRKKSTYTSTRNSCCPTGYVADKKEGVQKQPISSTVTSATNPYTKVNFTSGANLDLSSDEDFQPPKKSYVKKPRVKGRGRGRGRPPKKK